MPLKPKKQRQLLLPPIDNEVFSNILKCRLEQAGKLYELQRHLLVVGRKRTLALQPYIAKLKRELRADRIEEEVDMNAVRGHLEIINTPFLAHSASPEHHRPDEKCHSDDAAYGNERLGSAPRE